MNPPEQPTLSEIKTEKEQADSTTGKKHAFIFFGRIMSIIPQTNSDDGEPAPEIPSRTPLYIS